MQRSDLLARLSSSKEEWDILVIGGGATGLGTALDAVSRGYRTVLVEAHDFAKGTSSRSTKLIHGGVRYLKQGQVGMVRESLAERGYLLRNAPDIVHALRFVIPTYSRRSQYFYYAGMKAYDWLAGRSGIAPSRLLNRQRTLQLLPTLAEDSRLCGGVQYSDGQFDDAHLAIALAQAINSRGGLAVNYSAVTAIDAPQGGSRRVQINTQHPEQQLDLYAKVVINATGVFSKSISSLDEQDTKSSDEVKILPSRGTHLVLDRDFWPTDVGMLIPKTDDGRMLFAIPWLGKTLIGTTDLAVETIEMEPKPAAHEIDYLLEHFGRYATMKPQRQDVRSLFAGLRPLVKKGTASSSAALSREHEIIVSSTGMISIIGGKWTTYRKMGQDVIDLAARTGALPSRRSSTRDIRLETDRSGGDAGAQPNDAMIALAVKDEYALTVEDILARRSRLLLLDAQAAIDAAPATAEKMAQLLGHSDEWARQQVEQFEALAHRYLPTSE